MGRAHNSYRQDCNLAKAARQGIADQRPVSGKRSKKDKQVALECRMHRFGMSAEWTKWRRWRAYESAELAETVRTIQQRKLPRWEWRVTPIL